MCIVAATPRIASAAAVLSGHYGDVSRHARQRGVCRQWIYREADWVVQRLHGQPWLLDWKRLYGNCHTFRTGRRRQTSPYERLGVPLPKGIRWWELLKMTPEQLRDKLSTLQQTE